MSYSGASVSTPRRSSEFGSRRAGWDDKGTIVLEDIPVTSAHVDAVIIVGATQAAGVTIQMNYADGTAIQKPQDFDLYVVTVDAGGLINGLAVTGGSTGIAIGAAGFIASTPVAKKVFKCFTSKAGLINLTWTDNASEAASLVVRMPSGRLIVSALLPTS